MTNPFSLEGKNAWITGASYGIGFNIAKAFVAAGIKNIIFNDINEAALEKGLANYKAEGIENVHGYVCDVTDENAVKALVEKIHAEVGQIDILVNNAGIIKRIPMHEMKRAEFQQVIDVDLVAPYIVSAAVIPEMMERREGKIINICSMMSELGRETVSAYAAAKGGVNTEMHIVLVELIIAVLDEKGIETAAFSLECIDAVGPVLEAKSMTFGLLLRFCVYGWLIAKCVKSMAKGVVHDLEREVADMVTFVREDVVADLHVVVLRLLEQEDFGIQVAHVANAKLHVGGCLYSSFAVIDDRCFAHSAEESVEALGAVPAG